MNRQERRRLEREKKMSDRSEDKHVIDTIAKYAPRMTKFKEDNAGATLFDWMLTLDMEELADLQGEKECDKAPVLYLALHAHSLETGSSTIEDENPGTEDSTIMKLFSAFAVTATNARLQKAGLLEFRQDSTSFFDYEEGWHIRVTDKGRAYAPHVEGMLDPGAI